MNSNSLRFQFYSYPCRYCHSIGSATGSSMLIAQCCEQIAHRREYCFERKINSNSLHFQFYSYPYRYWYSVGGATGSSLLIVQCSEQIARRREYCFERKANSNSLHSQFYSYPCKYWYISLRGRLAVIAYISSSTVIHAGIGIV